MPFFKLLLGKTMLPIFAILGTGVLYVILMSFIDHQTFPFPKIILVLALTKTILISYTTLKQLSKMIKVCHSLERLLWVFGLIIAISVVSFATDYTCLYQYDTSSFKGMATTSDTYIYDLYQFLYFSVVTFSTAGFGDIAAISGVARFIVMLEIFVSFFIVVFAFANVKNIQIED